MSDPQSSWLAINFINTYEKSDTRSAASENDKKYVSADWPAEGAIDFRNVSFKYQPKGID